MATANRLATSEDVADVTEGDRLRVSYTSVHGNEKTIEGDVVRTSFTLHPETANGYVAAAFHLTTDDGGDIDTIVSVDGTPDGTPMADVKTKRRAHDSRSGGELHSVSASWVRVSDHSNATVVVI